MEKGIMGGDGRRPTWDDWEKKKEDKLMEEQILGQWGGVGGGQIERAVLFEEAKEHGSWSNLVRGRLTLRRKEERRRHMERSSTRHPRRHHRKRKRPTLDLVTVTAHVTGGGGGGRTESFKIKGKLENKNPSISSARTDHKGERRGGGKGGELGGK